MARLKLFLPLLIFLVLAALLLRGLELDPTALPSALKDKAFPEFQLTALANPAQQLGVDDLRGKAALVNVWATWCISCKVEHAQLREIASEGVPIYGVNYKDERKQALAWLHELGDPYIFNIFDDEGRLGFDLGVYGAPETYLIDAAGIIRYKHVGVVTRQVWTENLRPIMQQLESEK